MTIPSHYAKCCATIEPRELLKMMPFQLGCACKYLLRYQHKGRPVEDLKKALDYLRWAYADGEIPHADVFALVPFFKNDLLSELFHAESVWYDMTISVVEAKIRELETPDMHPDAVAARRYLEAAE